MVCNCVFICTFTISALGLLAIVYQKFTTEGMTMRLNPSINWQMISDAGMLELNN